MELSVAYQVVGGGNLVHGNRTESGRVDKQRLEVANNNFLEAIWLYANNRQAVDDGGLQSDRGLQVVDSGQSDIGTQMAVFRIYAHSC